MNKKIKLILLFAMVSPSVWAVSLKLSDSSMADNLPKTIQNLKENKKENNKLIKVGRVNLIDLSSNLIIVNNQRYNLDKEVKIYDGKLETKKFIRFVLSEEKKIIEIWVHK